MPSPLPSPDDPAAWLVLKSVPGLGNLRIKRLIDRFGGAEQVLAASPALLASVPGISSRLAHAVAATRVSEAMRVQCRRSIQAGICFVTLTSTDYPPLLREITDPPPLLSVLGSLPVTTRAVAVVGSRSASAYGLDTARRLGRDLAAAGWVVVSGMAVGIDTAAHQGALESGGPTVAVLGSGLGCLYPPENSRLAADIRRCGAIVSELPFSAQPDPHHFPARNRIISGMTRGTVVVEAARKSGSLITARLAGEQGREVFAVPGSVRSFKSSGTHQLIRQGAKLVEHAGDILEEIGPSAALCATETLTPHLSRDLSGLCPDARRIVRALGPDPVHMDTLVADLSMPPARLTSLLLDLELQGLIRRSSGGMVLPAS